MLFGRIRVRSLLAGLIPFGTFVVQWILWPLLRPFEWVSFAFTVAVSAWIGGATSGIWATAISALLVWWAFIPPERAFAIAEAQFIVSTAIFVSVGLALSALQGRPRRTTRGPILVQSQMLVRRGPEPERRSLRPVEAIRRNATRMNRLIADLLDVTRLEAEGLSIEPARVGAAARCARPWRTSVPLASTASLEIGLEVARDLPEVWADRERLLQVLENLIGNAIKFTESGGRITVGASRSDGEDLFRVSDTGRGIAAEQVPHVFARFWQSRRGGRSGAGLGLPIVKGLVEAQGGRIWVETAPGRGSTFRFTIPTARDGGTGPAAWR